MSVADRARWYRQLRWPAPCEEAFDATRVTDDGGLKFVELEPGRSLVIVRCAGGAYQPSSTLLLLDERGATPVASALELETLASLDGKSLTRAREAEVTGEITMLDHRTLTILTLARQIGDCGTWGRYEFHDGSLVLTAGAERVTCPADPGPRAEPKVGEPPAGWKPIAIQ
ncbi:MAG: hypothetical protein MNPFHGCM_02160 [Gemmatimonadaceae bacterium]|nr:hypothetical protein [Gemmatimonadaceae bacterium]